MQFVTSQENLVATVVGWRCCCDVDLLISGESWEGTGFSRKDKRGVRFDLKFLRSDEMGYSLMLHIRSEGEEFETQIVALAQNPDACFFSVSLADYFGEPTAQDGTDRNLLRFIIGKHQSVKSLFRNYAFGLSYMPVVLDLFERQAPRNILEWGPGRSSIFFAELFPDSQISGVEHNERWFDHCQKLSNFFPNVEIVCRKLAIAPAQAEGYVSFPLFNERKYDLIFVDGRLRADCVAMAGLVLGEGGVVLLHDAHRKNYPPCFELFEDVEIRCNTAILRQPKRKLQQ